jgi:hypothetical protein
VRAVLALEVSTCFTKAQTMPSGRGGGGKTKRKGGKVTMGGSA